MNPCGLTVAVSALANALAQRLDDEELSLLGAVFNQLGDTLSTIAAHRNFCENRQESE